VINISIWTQKIVKQRNLWSEVLKFEWERIVVSHHVIKINSYYII